MSHIVINTLADLQYVLQGSICITGDESCMQEEIYHNMCALTFSEDLILTIQIEDLQTFLADLLIQRNAQVCAQNPTTPATFYLWFDEQTLQLRFNLLSGADRALPFGCTVNQMDTPEPILQNFITTTRRVMVEGDVIEYFEPGDEGFDDDADEDPKKYVLDVYAVTLNAPSPTIDGALSTLKNKK